MPLLLALDEIREAVPDDPYRDRSSLSEGVGVGAGLTDSNPSKRQDDDTLGVVWDIPKNGGGSTSEAVCWREGCGWRVQADDRQEVERLMTDHQKRHDAPERDDHGYIEIEEGRP